MKLTILHKEQLKNIFSNYYAKYLSQNNPNRHYIIKYNKNTFTNTTFENNIKLGQCNGNTEDENEVSRDDVSFNIYPNPAHSYINVSLKGGLEISNVLIYDFTGKIVQQNRIENQNQLQEIDSRIELRSLSNGIYFIKIIDVHGIEITKKLIKRDS